MKKSIILYSVASGLGVVGIVLASTLSFKTVIFGFKEGNGTSRSVKTVEEGLALLHDRSLKKTDYYTGVYGGGEKEEDFSVSIEVTGKYENKLDDVAYDRIMKLIMNQDEILYQFDGSMKDSLSKVDLTYDVSLNKNGLFLKYDKYFVSEIFTNVESKKTEINEKSKILNKHKGKWFKVGLSDSHLSEIEGKSQQELMQQGEKAFIYYMCQQSVQLDTETFFQYHNSNIDFMNHMYEYGVSNFDDFGEKSYSNGKKVENKWSTGDLSIILRDEKSPVFTYRLSAYDNKIIEEENFKFYYIDNSVMPKQNFSKLDYVDLLYGYYKEAIRRG